ncbi:MAG: hypothetical protein HY261_10620 [Chloroflexi bacterium]|nr:hypothetical protein [Chloroflexota bacterium]
MAKKGLSGKHLAMSIGLVLLSFGLTALLWGLQDQVKSLGGYGYLGVFLFALAANMPVVTVFPWLLVIAPLGAVYNPGLLAVTAASGATLGELLPYALGSNIAPNLPSTGILRRLTRLNMWQRTIVVLGMSLSPAFSFPGLAAGVLRYPLWATLSMKFVTELPKVYLVTEGWHWLG